MSAAASSQHHQQPSQQQQSGDSVGSCSWEGVAELSATPTTPSLLYNNLTESRGLLAYCSGSHVSVVHITHSATITEDAECFVQGEQATLVASAELKHHRDAFATTALIVRPPKEASARPAAALVVATTATVDFFQLPEAGKTVVNAPLVHTTNLTETPVNPLARIMSRGLATLPSKTPEVTVLTGTATGVIMMHTIQFRPLADGNKEGEAAASAPFSVIAGPSMQTPCCSITCIAVPSPAQQKNSSMIRWLCADDDGCICVYERPANPVTVPPASSGTPAEAAEGAEDAEHVSVSAAPSTCSALGWDRVGLFAGNGVPCTGAGFLPDPRSTSTTPDYVVAAYASGHVRLLSLVTNSIVAEIAAHSRSITALAVHPQLPYVVSVAEDSWVRAWALWHSVSNPSAPNSAHHGRMGSSQSSEGLSALGDPASSRMQKFDITQQWSAFMPFFMWTGVSIVPRTTGNNISHDISVVAYDLGALFTFHAKPVSFAIPSKIAP